MTSTEDLSHDAVARRNSLEHTPVRPIDWSQLAQPVCERGDIGPSRDEFSEKSIKDKLKETTEDVWAKISFGHRTSTSRKSIGEKIVETANDILDEMYWPLREKRGIPEPPITQQIEETANDLVQKVSTTVSDLKDKTVQVAKFAVAAIRGDDIPAQPRFGTTDSATTQAGSASVHRRSSSAEALALPIGSQASPTDTPGLNGRAAGPSDVRLPHHDPKATVQTALPINHSSELAGPRSRNSRSSFGQFRESENLMRQSLASSPADATRAAPGEPAPNRRSSKNFREKDQRQRISTREALNNLNPLNF